MKKFLILLIIILSVNTAIAQWQKCNGPYSGFIYCLATNTTGIFAGTNNGIYFTNNGGQNWLEISNGLRQKNVTSLAVLGTKVFAGTKDSGLFITSNNGALWSRINAYPFHLISAIAVYNNKIYIAVNGSGVVYSQDSGSTWINMGNNGLNLNLLDIAVNDTTIFAATSYGLYQTYNNGVSWQQTNLSILSQFNSVCCKGSKVIATSTNGIYISENKGLNWIASIIDSIGLGVAYTTAVSDTFIYAGSFYDGIYRSSDNGLSWQHYNSGVTNLLIHKLLLSGNDIYAATHGGGVFKSTNNGVSWNQFNNGISNTLIHDITGNGTDLFTIDRFGNGIQKTSDNGLSWTSANSGITERNFNNIIAKGSTIFTTNSQGIFRSINSGLSWTKSNNGFDTTSYASSIAFTANKVIAGDDYNGGFYISSDNGANWVLNTNNGIYTYLRTNSFTARDDTVYGLTLSGIVKSINGGVSWSTIYDPFPKSFQMGKISLIGSNILVSKYPMVILPDEEYGWLGISSNNGYNFTDVYISIDLPSIRSMSSNNTFVFAATNHGIFITGNQGWNWTNITYNLSDSNITKVFINGSYVYASLQYGGVWRRLLSDFAGMAINENVKANDLIIYPNPAKDKLIIELKAKKVLLNTFVYIYNIQGQLLKQIAVKENKTDIDIQSFNTGVYIVKVKNEIETLVSRFVKDSK